MTLATAGLTLVAPLVRMQKPMPFDVSAVKLMPQCKATRSWTRSVAKTVTWRLFATIDTFIISSLVTGSLKWAGSIVGIELLTKMTLYLLHERAWALARVGVVEPVATSER